MANRPMLRWGVLGAARIATTKVIPAMQRCTSATVMAIASRDLAKAQEAAASLGIAKAYGSYEALLADPDVEVIYNPLPNHLHVPWTVRAAEAGKHVLCEKPIALSVAETTQLLRTRDRTGMHIQEAFMIRTHPQWLAAVDAVRSGRLGELRAIVGCFSYFNRDPVNIRNVAPYGGGALMDIGCYLVHTARWLFDTEPRRVAGAVERDPAFGVDRLTSLLLDFGSGHAAGTCGTQMVPYQRVQILGSTGRLEIEIPFNAPPDRPCRIHLDDGADVFGGGMTTAELDSCDQYTLQGDLFSKAILERTGTPYPLEDSTRNMAVIEAVFRSAESGRWEAPETV
jgi:predicted dehydrogenase